MDTEILTAFTSHAEEGYPKEVCGLIVNKRYIPCRNISDNPEDNFILDPEDYALAEDKGVIEGICHSHPNSLSNPSEADISLCNSTNKVWYILSLPGRDLKSINPEKDLLGRTFEYGVIDCCSLIKDYYAKNYRLFFECTAGEDEWWLRGENRYLDNYSKQGFVSLEDTQPIEGDVFLIKLLSPVPNHAAIYIGDNNILHHIHGRLSNRENYSGYWSNFTTHHLRHKSLC